MRFDNMRYILVTADLFFLPHMMIFVDLSWV